MANLLNMKPIASHLACPSCSHPLRPKLLVCDECGITVEGPFQFNEFTRLSLEDLHFLRIFVHCEGRIREMESPLGLSYPTIRARLTALKNRLEGAPIEEVPASRPAREADPSVVSALSELSEGKIDFDEALARIRKRR